MDANLNTPYHYVREYGFERIEDDVKDLLGGNEWYNIAMQCTPKTLAAGAVYYLHKTRDDLENQTQVEVAEEFDTTPMSVRNGYKHVGIHTGMLNAEEVSLPHE